jgi:mannose-6-phosphate isomerase-like protein (cupin superfamily)
MSEIGTRDIPVVAAGQGDAYWWFGTLAEIKATAAETDGLFTLVEVTHPPGYEAPLHVHHNEHEGFWILDGDVTFDVGGTKLDAGPGDYALGPRDVPHSYRVGDAGCRMLYVLTPGGFEGLIRETGEPADTRIVPPPAGEPPDPERLGAALAKYGCERLAP